MKRNFLFRLFPPLLALVLETLPWGAVLYFGLDGGRVVRSSYSYFSLIPFGYANFSPFCTAILTCILIISLLISVKKKSQKLQIALFVLSNVTLLVSLCPLLMGFRYYTVISGGISFALFVETVFLYFSKRGRKGF